MSQKIQTDSSQILRSAFAVLMVLTFTSLHAITRRPVLFPLMCKPKTRVWVAEKEVRHDRACDKETYEIKYKSYRLNLS